MRQPEGRIVRQILDYLRGRGGRWMKIQGSESSFQEAGISDIVGCYYGLFVAIEVKQPGGKLSKLQERFLKDIDANGGYTCVAESVSDVMDLLTKIDAVRRKHSEASQTANPHGRRHRGSTSGNG